MKQVSPFFCCCCCGHVGNALALSKRSGMSTAPLAQAFRLGLRVRSMLSPSTSIRRRCPGNHTAFPLGAGHDDAGRMVQVADHGPARLTLY
jgi:hypothetical protein